MGDNDPGAESIPRSREQGAVGTARRERVKTQQTQTLHSRNVRQLASCDDYTMSYDGHMMSCEIVLAKHRSKHLNGSHDNHVTIM